MIGLAAISAIYGARELSAARMDPGEGPFAMYFWSGQTAPVSSGNRQQRRLLSSCLSLLAAPEFAFHVSDVRVHLSASCAMQARHAELMGAQLAEIPAILAVEEIEAGNPGAVMALLAQSRAMAPTDLEMILHRLRIAFRADTAEHLSRPGGILEAELPVLIGSGRGIQTAVSLYVQLPDIRPLVDRLADDLPAVDRERFLGVLRRQLRG